MKQQPLTVCGEILYAPIHICGFFNSRDDQYSITLPYMQEGLGRNEKIVNILAKARHADHCERLLDYGISVEEKTANRQLDILATEDTYLKGGNFEAERMLQLLEDALIEAAKEGFDSVRACGEMEWALRNVKGTDELIEYEARLNLLTPKHSCSLICMYDINQFSGRVVTDILATHSHVIMNDKIHKNPYYIEPLEFLPALQRRRQRALVPGV